MMVNYTTESEKAWYKSPAIVAAVGVSAIAPFHNNVPVNTDEKLRELLQLLKDSQQGSQEQERLKNQLCKLIPHLPGSRKYREPDAKIDFDGELNEA